MPTILDYYEYAKLANAAYVRLEAVGQANGRYVDTQIAAAANNQERIPTALAERMVIARLPSGWLITAPKLIRSTRIPTWSKASISLSTPRSIAQRLAATLS